LSEPVEAQLKRTGNPVAAGKMIIVSACLLIVFNLVAIFQYSSFMFTYSSYFGSVAWIQLSSFAVSILLDVLALLGGVQALVKRHLVFAVFGTSILFTISLSSTISILASLARALTQNLTVPATVSVYEVFPLTLFPLVLVLSILSLIYLAKSKPEFP
jgi:hypothetical protein